MEPIPVDLSAVPQTPLWNLGRRAAAARAARSLLDDPLAIEVACLLRDHFPDTSRANWHAVRVATFDDAVRRFLGEHPAGQVAALGEGLETQFWRVDNGRVQLADGDFPETLTLGRCRPTARDSAATPDRARAELADQLDPATPAPVTAQGLLPSSSAARFMSSSRRWPGGFPVAVRLRRRAGEDAPAHAEGVRPRA